MAGFKLDIELGGVQMSTPQDVADVLERVASQLRVPVIASQEESHQRLYDVNGNTIGEWHLMLPDLEEE